MRGYLIAFLHTTMCNLTGEYELYGGLYLLHILYLQNKITQLSKILVTMYSNTDHMMIPAGHWRLLSTGAITWLLVITVTDCSATIHSVQTYSTAGSMY